MFQLKTFPSLETDTFLLSIYNIGFSVKASKFLSLFFGVNKVVTFFKGFPARVKEIEHFIFVKFRNIPLN